jgi:hypothetical protein
MEQKIKKLIEDWNEQLNTIRNDICNYRPRDDFDAVEGFAALIGKEEMLEQCIRDLYST